MSSEYTIEFDICSYCKRNTAYPEYQYMCKKCYKKDYKLKNRYNLTIDDYQDLLQQQEHRCKICLKSMVTPHVDHDHKTGEVRGLLCRTCNIGLGHFKDSPKILSNALNYLI